MSFPGSPLPSAKGPSILFLTPQDTVVGIWMYRNLGAPVPPCPDQGFLVAGLGTHGPPFLTLCGFPAVTEFPGSQGILGLDSHPQMYGRVAQGQHLIAAGRVNAVRAPRSACPSGRSHTPVVLGLTVEF